MSVVVKSAPKAKTPWQNVEPFVLGGASGMVQIQLAGEGQKGAGASPVKIARELVAKNGFGYLYKGLSAGLLRQATYTTARLGLFRNMSDAIEKTRPTTFAEKALIGLVAGGLGSIVGTPADLALIRIQADSTLPLDQRRNYTGVVNALTRITKEEGFKGLFKGCAPVVVRAMSLNAGMLASHDQAQVEFAKLTDNYWLQNIGAKGLSGLTASACSLPFDFVKTRIQKQKPDANGVLPYANSIDCAKQVMTKEGPLAFYRGFGTYCARIAPHVIITLFALDGMKYAINKYSK